MGSYCSCFGRQKSNKSDIEHGTPYQPLINTPEDDALEPPVNTLEKLSDILAALSAGKLPSEDQLETFTREALKSDVLDVSTGGLSEGGRKVVGDLREVCESVLRVGMEKNHDDLFQNLYYHYTLLTHQSAKVDLNIKTKTGSLARSKGEVVESIPTKDELSADAATSLRAIRDLSTLFLTSSTFRLLLSDFFLTSREILADAAASVGEVAEKVEVKAEKVEDVLRPDGDGEAVTDKDVNTLENGVEGAMQDASGVKEETKEHWKDLSGDAPDRIRESFLERWNELLIRARQSPKYRASLLTLLSLVQKYYSRFYSVAHTINPPSTSQNEDSGPEVVVSTNIIVDDNLQSFFEESKTGLERLAGQTSLDPLLGKAHTTFEDLAQSDDQGEIRDWFEDVGKYLQRVLNTAVEDQSTSTEDDEKWMREDAERLYDRARALSEVEEHATWLKDLKATFSEADQFLKAVSNDKASLRLIRSIETLLLDTSSFLSLQKLRSEAGNQIRHDVLSWLVPRLLRLMRAVPMPRVEFKSPRLEGVVDSLVLRGVGASLVPDHVFVQSLEEMRLDYTASADGDREAEMYVRTKVHVDGLRVAASGVSYYFRLMGGWFGWEDSGLLDVLIGSPSKEDGGLSMDLELDTSPSPSSLFRVLDVKLDIPGLTFKIRRSKHWILNTLFVQPMSELFVRGMMRNVLTGYVKSGLERVDGRVAAVWERAKGKAEDPGVGEYWESLMEEFQEAAPEENEPQPEPEPATEIQTETHATFKGVVHKTTTHTNGDLMPEETVLAIGAGEQILPGKGGPVLEDANVPAEVAREAAEDLQSGAEAVQRRAEEAGEVRKDVQRAGERMDQRRGVEKEKSGWRSDVFDL